MAKNNKDHKDDSKPIQDVSHPGESTPSPTSKPVIVTNRSLLRDPMMAQPAADDEDPDKDSKKIDLSKVQAPTIQPLPTSELSDSAKEKGADEAPQKKDETLDDPSAQPHGDENKPDEETDGPLAPPEPEIEKNEPDSTGTSEIQSGAAAETPPSGDTSATPEQLDQPDTSGQFSSDDPNAPSPDAPETHTEPSPGDTDIKKSEDASKAAEKAKHDAAIQELVMSKKYELPINSIEKRKNKKQAVMVAAAVLVLVFAWLGFSLATGIINIGGSHTPTPSTSTGKSTTQAAAPSTVKNQTYTSHAAGVSFTYPSSWQLNTATPAAGQESTVLEPSAAALGSQEGLYSVEFERNAPTSAPSTPPSGVTYTVAAIRYQRLPKSNTTTALYMQQFIVKISRPSGDRYMVYLNLSATESLKAGQAITSPSDVLAAPFSTGANADKLTFTSTLAPSVNSQPGATSLSAAQDFVGTDSFAKQAKAILLSFKDK